MEKHKIAAVIPSHNENIKVLKKVLNSIQFCKIIVLVDDNSKPKIKINKKNIQILRNKMQLGYEKSLIKGIRHVLLYKKNINYLFTIDADYQHKINYLIKNIKKIKKNDITIFTRKSKNRVLENFLSQLFYKKFKIKDPLSGFKIYNINAFSKINLNQVKLNDYLVDLLYLFYKNNVSIGHISSTTRSRRSQPKVGSYFSVNFKIIKIFCKYLMYRII